MEIRHLQYFLAVARELSFTEAAKSLHMSVPPLSRSIKALEKELDVQLFDRSTRYVALTPAGKMLVPLAAALVADSEALREKMRPDDNAPLPVRFVVHDLLRIKVQGLLLTMISHFSGRYMFSVRQLPSLEMPQRLLDNNVDAALSHIHIAVPELQSLTLGYQQLRILVRSSAFPGRTSLRVEDLRGMTCVCFPTRWELPQIRRAQQAFFDSGVRDGGQAEYSAVEGQLLALKSKDEFSLTGMDTEDLNARLRNSSEFDLLPVDDLDLDLPVVLAWRERDERFTRAAHEIADFLNNLHPEQADQATHTAPAHLC
jgi:DNA-binding transcriptional LysR family regulator